MRNNNMDTKIHQHGSIHIHSSRTNNSIHDTTKHKQIQTKQNNRNRTNRRNKNKGETMNPPTYFLIVILSYTSALILALFNFELGISFEIGTLTTVSILNIVDYKGVDI